MKKVIFVGGARDYHAMDWYWNAKEVCTDKEILFATDLIGGEGFEVIVKKSDKIIPLLIIDKLLFRNQSSLGDKWRNLLKLLVLPIQILKLKRLARKYPNSAFHAHGMYYMFLCALSGVPYTGTPQGSEILVRPYRSNFYRKFASKGLREAQNITIDSVRMRDGIFEISGAKATIIQNGIDIGEIQKRVDPNIKKTIVFSHRGFTPLYRINEMLEARNNTIPKLPITFVYPFWDETYKDTLTPLFIEGDKDLGRVARDELYALLNASKLVLSIPISDSSPRSVYEAIFCGACVAIRPNPYIDILPNCMKERLIVLDLHDTDWLVKAVEKAEEIVAQPYKPSLEALEMFDEKKSMKKLSKLFY